MDNKKWTAVAGVLLLAAFVASVIFLQQRNEARQHLSESRNQITDLDQRNVELKESVAKHKSLLSTEADLAEKKQSALVAAENQITELKDRLDKRQAKLNTIRNDFQQASGEIARLQMSWQLVRKGLPIFRANLTGWKRKPTGLGKTWRL